MDVYYVLGHNHCGIFRDNSCLGNMFLPGTVTTTRVYKHLTNSIQLVGSTL